MPPSRRRTPRQARSKDKVDRILAAARELLVAGGSAAFNTNKIAERAGVGIGSVYEYFPNKQAIVDSLVEQLSIGETDTMLAKFADVEQLDVAAAVRTLVATLFELYQRNYDLYRVLWSLAPNPREVGHRPGERMVMDEMRRRLEPLGFADLDLTVFTMFHMVESLCGQFAAQGVDRFGAEACVAEISGAALRYLGVDEPG
jgi:AcrR family transcriptional regulator